MATQPSSNSNELEPLLPPSPTKKVWYKTASVYWLLPAFLMLSITYGMGEAPKVQFYLRAVCYDYYSKKGQFPLAPFSLSPIDDNYPDEWCNNADVQAVTSQFLMILNLCSAIPAIFILGPLGSLSDRKGRKICLLITTMGIILTTLNILLVGNFLETLGLYSLLIGSLIEGISGGIISLFATSFSYTADCTSSGQRSVAFGWMQGCFFVGFALGPTIGGWIVEITNSLLSVFYVMTVIYTILFLSFLFVLPESLTKENLLDNLKRQQGLNLTFNTNRSLISRLIHSVFQPLTIFFQNNRGKFSNIATKHSLLLLAITNTFLAASIIGVQAVILLYTTLAFKWSLVDQGYFLFGMGASRAFVLLILFPILVRNFKSKSPIKNNNNDNEQIFVDDEDINNNDKQMGEEFTFEIWVLRLALLIDTFAYASCGLTTSSSVFVGAIITASLGSVAIPTIKSLLTNLVAPSQIGQLLGALSVLDSIIRIISPIIFNTLYSILVVATPKLIWFSVAVSIAITCLFSFSVVLNKHN